MSEHSGFLKQIRLKNFLSFGEEGQTLDLKPLNVFIGPNASGKSNLIEALRFLRAATENDPEKDIAGEISKRDGITNWIWKGQSKDKTAELQVYTDSDPRLKLLIEYDLKFAESDSNRFEIVEEKLERYIKIGEEHHTPKFDYYYHKGSKPVLVTDMWGEITQKVDDIVNHNISEHTRVEDLDLNKSILSQRKDPERFPNVTYLAKKFSEILIYSCWDLEYNSIIRKPQKTDMYQDFLLENASNLSLIMSHLLQKPAVPEIVEKYIKKFYPFFDSLGFGVEGGISFFIKELGLRTPVSAKRVSDGFLRFLCLLSILCHPKPPPVICIEEPELNMHPDIMPTIAELLIEASSRTQLFVTTHSEMLVSALSETPENVIVCERTLDGTTLNRLDKKDLDHWLEKYTLGDLWAMGKIGGNP